MIIGEVVPPDFQTNTELIECAKEVGLYWSFVNVNRYVKYDEIRFKEALKDWGFHGPDQLRPNWIAVT